MAKNLGIRFLVLIVAALISPAAFDASIIQSITDSHRSTGLDPSTRLHGSFGRDYKRLDSGARESTTKKMVSVFETEDDLAVSIARYIADLSDKFIKEKGIFTVVLSGGYLIDSLRVLMQPQYVESIEWSKWYIFWVDERNVPRDHVDSNYKLAMDGFMSKVPIIIGNVYAINDSLTNSTEKAAEDYETRIRKLVDDGIIDTAENGYPKFDLMLLGMGPDGHIASLFPNHPQINETKKWVTHIEDSPKLPPKRITFTLPVINASPYIAFVMVGDGEVDAVCAVLGKCETPTHLPAQRVLPDGELKWFLDKLAASKMLDL